ncbi:GAF domain-containing protein [Klenkia brasiliensis]|uniref:GAF domain-containing protein n=1 Tax=Klenkia brasiliensis TaxID=333142 RepID=A0A1G7PGY9_9ACTN|nr:GAF domain-containing protein [Klenkia brasiliensis]
MIGAAHGTRGRGRGGPVAEKTATLFTAGLDDGIREVVLATDWAATPLGEVSTWPESLRAAVGICLNNPFPMLVMWGPELVMVYNAGYAPILGDKHPWAMGRPCAEVWAELWPTIRGRLDGVLAGTATYDVDLPLLMHRHGFDEATWFTFAYSPITDPDGRVVGVLNTTSDTTGRVLGARRLTALQAFAEVAAARHGDTDRAASAAMAALTRAPDDVPFGLVYLLDPDGRSAHLAATTWQSGPPPAALVTRLPTGGVADWAWEAITTGTVQVTDGLAARLPGFVPPRPGALTPADVDQAVALPLVVAGQSAPIGVLVAGVAPQLRLDEDYLSFLELVAGQVAAVVTDAQAYQAERRRAAERAEAEREVARAAVEVSVVLQRSILGPVELPEGFAVRYEPAARALEVGGDWYDVVQLADEVFGVVVGDVVGRGLPAAAVMGQLRSAGRALLLEANGPAQVLSALDRFAELVPGATCSTVFCAVVDRRAGTLRCSSAGHLPAVLVGADGTARLLDGAQSLPLAVATGLARPETEVALAPGDSLLLYTDGLVERRHEALDEGIDRAVTAVVEGRALSPDVLASVLVDQLLDEQEDDVALLVYRHPAEVAAAP